MASYTNGFQTDEDKYKNVDNIFVRKAKTGRKQTKGEVFWDNFIDWVTYFRDNPHRFCVEYLGINLHWWQQLVLYAMWFTGNTMFLASRGTGKTYLTMAYCIAKCLLFPGLQIRVAAANKKQAGFLLAKTKEIQRTCPNVAREIIDISIGKDEARITFHGGSEIATVVAGEGARGERCHIVIVDEREIVDKEVIDKVFVPFLSAIRQPPYLRKKEYKKYEELETNHFIELSSIGSTTSSMYKEFQDYIKYACQGVTDYIAFSIPYQIPFSSGVINRKLMEKMVRESTTGVEAFRQEMEVIPTGDSESSMFRYEDLNKNRKIRVPLYPITDDEYIECKGDIKKYPYYQRKEPYEVRVIAYDIARSSGRQNDLSVFTIFRLTPNGEFYDKEIAYIETMNGVDTESQILRFKQLFYDLECDFATMDCAGIGRVFLDIAMKRTDDTMRNKKYPPWKPRNDVEKYLEGRAVDPSSEPVLYAMIVSGASAQQVQAAFVGRARVNFEKKMMKLLVNESDIEDELHKRYKYYTLKSSGDKRDNDTALRLISPYIQTSKFIEEAIHTQVIHSPSGGLSIDEKNGRKDRLMSFLYGVFFIDLLEQDLQVVPEQEFNFNNLVANLSGNQNRKTAFGTPTSNPFSSRQSLFHR